MGIFGMLDAANIPTNPFFIEAGEYAAEVVVAKYQTRNDKKQLYIQYSITDENSQFYGSKPSKAYDLVDDDMTAAKLALLPADEQKKIRNSNAALKRDLCGNEANITQKGLGVALDDLNDANWNPESVIGTKVHLGISNYGADGQGVNIRWVNLAQ